MSKAETPNTVAVGPAALAQMIAQGITAGMQAIAPQKEIKEGDPEYTERLKVEGFFDEFERPVFQNGKKAQARGLSEQTRHRASFLTPGSYIVTPKNPKGRVRVDVDSRGSVYLSYPTNMDALSDNRDYWSSFTDLIDKIWAEMHPAQTTAA